MVTGWQFHFPAASDTKTWCMKYSLSDIKELLNYTRNFPLLWHLTIHCQVHNSPLLIPTLRHIQQSTPSNTLSFRSILILFTHLHPVLKEMTSFQVFQPKFCELPIHATCPTHLIFQAMTNQNKSHIIKSPLGS